MAEQSTSKQQSTSPKVGSPKSPSISPTGAGSPAGALLSVEVSDDYNDDADSALGHGDDAFSSTASISSSIFEYRTIKGRAYHSERHNSDYYAPVDERANASVDITHHYLTLLLDGKLHLAPVKDPKKVIDIGTGTGIWAIDFGDEHPAAEVIGTDLSPTQPEWVPPNVRFEIDDATKVPWTWADGTFEFVHIRYLFGAVADWSALFAQAFRTLQPGGWIESAEAEVDFVSDDATVAPDSALALWGRMCKETGEKIGRPFTVLTDNVQKTGLETAGFVDVQTVDFKVPVGGWPRDAKLAEVGRFVQLTLENDLEGYSTFMWNNVLGWPADEYQIFLMKTRKELKDRRVHSYLKVRYAYGRKPE
ncbi:S-adenosyl-L-methionine-dependent methyltransferase [Immersiella caudata]|uniref:S-adenosyl-L-methionine-dependent methyltransferase n=1 Tax=Immersiella caudata TaxID=314043 RepID=A0AA39WCP2_9PEZI|nr:S-adenosyl-L-methionine-dependent methyltransferase [Immersiella caudata]